MIVKGLPGKTPAEQLAYQFIQYKKDKEEVNKLCVDAGFVYYSLSGLSAVLDLISV